MKAMPFVSLCLQTSCAACSPIRTFGSRSAFIPSRPSSTVVRWSEDCRPCFQKRRSWRSAKWGWTIPEGKCACIYCGKQQLVVCENLFARQCFAFVCVFDRPHANDKCNQRTAFRRLLRLAVEHRKPVVLHVREASQDAIRILRDVRMKRRRPFADAIVLLKLNTCT